MLSKKHSYLLTFTHFCVDLNQGAIPAMLPYLLSSPSHMVSSYAAATGLVLANGIVSSVVQPIFGYIGDRVQKPWLMALGVFMSCLGISMFAVFTNYVLLFCSAMFCGLGVAIFHPEGGRLANVVAGSSKGEGMSNFGVGGTLGFSGGALLVTVFFGFFHLGMHGALIFMVPGVVAAVLVLSQVKNFKRLTAIEERRKAARGANQLKDDWPEFWKVSAVNTFRCIIFNATQTFIPLFWTGVFLVSESQGSLMLTIVSLVGAVGTFFGGRIADRLGFKRDIVSCTACLIAGIALFVLAANAYLQVLAAILVCLSMLFLQTAYSPVITLSQKQLPNHLGMASGIALGVSVSIGSICSPILGVIGDHCGLIVVFYIVLGLAVCVFLLSLFLKNDRSHSVAKREPETK